MQPKHPIDERGRVHGVSELTACAEQRIAANVRVDFTNANASISTSLECVLRTLGPNDLPRVGWSALSENPLNPSQSEKDVANKYGRATKSGRDLSSPLLKFQPLLFPCYQKCSNEKAMTCQSVGSRSTHD
jgi:hypothetical protein